MRIILMGPPGAGKGTQAEKMARELDIPHIATGDIFRKAVSEGTDLGKQAKSYMDAGQLVPDEVVIGIVEERLQKTDCQDGFILDGFPRTVAQAEALDQVLNENPLTAAVYIDVAKDELIERLSGRRICRKCGKSYHIKFNPPQVRGVCDDDGGELYQRDDDNEETARERLDVYLENTQPLVEYYQNRGILKKIDGSQKPGEVFQEIMNALSEKR